MLFLFDNENLDMGDGPPEKRTWMGLREQGTDRRGQKLGEMACVARSKIIYIVYINIEIYTYVFICTWVRHYFTASEIFSVGTIKVLPRKAPFLSSRPKHTNGWIPVYHFP